MSGLVHNYITATRNTFSTTSVFKVDKKSRTHHPIPVNVKFPPITAPTRIQNSSADTEAQEAIIKAFI